MARFFAHLLRDVARFARTLASLGLVFLSVRLAWLAAADALNTAGESARAGLGQEPTEERKRTEGTLDARVALQKGNNSHRPDLEKLKEPEGSDLSDSWGSHTPLKKVMNRDIVVDAGPERSEVFIDGRKVGHSPYVGQLPCLEGQPVKIEILPPQGPPIFRKTVCSGFSIVVH